MFVCPYMITSNPYFRSPEETSFIRVLHASPNSPTVDVYVNNRPTFRNVTYKKFTDYITLRPGTYNIKILPAGSTQNPIINTTLFVPGGTIYTVAAVGTAPNISLLPILDVRRPIIQGRTFIRFIHLSPDAPNVDVALPNNTLLFKNVKYKEVTKYIPVAPGKYTIEAKVSGTNQKVLSVPNINLRPNRFYSMYAVGYARKTPPLQLLVPLDGNSYLKFV